MKPLKILIIARSFKHGGAATGARNLVNSLSAAGLNVIQVSADTHIKKKSFKKLIRNFERIIERSFFGANYHCIKLCNSTIDIIDLSNKIKPDIIQLCDISANTIDINSIGKIEIPVVHRMSDLWPYQSASHYAQKDSYFRSMAANLMFTIFIRWHGTITWQLVAPSQWLSATLKKKHANSKVCIIKNSVETTSSFKHGKIILKNDILRIGFSAQHLSDKRKGLINLIDFLNKITSFGLLFELHLFGMPNRSIKRKLSNFPIIFHGEYIQNSQLENIYSKFHILICPSVLDNSPNVVTEALSFGVPAVVQENSGACTYVEAGRNGFHTNFLDHSTSNLILFKDNINSLINEYTEYSANAIYFARNELSYLEIGQKYLQLYQNISGPQVSSKSENPF